MRFLARDDLPEEDLAVLRIPENVVRRHGSVCLLEAQDREGNKVLGSLLVDQGGNVVFRSVNSNG